MMTEFQALADQICGRRCYLGPLWVAHGLHGRHSSRRWKLEISLFVASLFNDHRHGLLHGHWCHDEKIGRPRQYHCARDPKLVRDCVYGRRFVRHLSQQEFERTTPHDLVAFVHGIVVGRQQCGHRIGGGNRPASGFWNGQ